MFNALFGVKTLSGTLFASPFNETGYGARFAVAHGCSTTYGALCPGGTMVPADATVAGGCPTACTGRGLEVPRGRRETLPL